MALLADRVSRVKSIVVMATVWSMATISCMFTTNFGQLFSARAVVGAGETGYGSVGAALIATLFPVRLRSALLGAFFAAASLGSVLGVVLGGVIAAKWGWRAAFGVVGVPGLALALLYLFVRDYKTVDLTPKLDKVTESIGTTLKHIFVTLGRTRTLLFVCIGAAMQLSWCRPSGRGCRATSTASTASHPRLRPSKRQWWCWSARWAASSGAIVVDRLTLRQPRNKLLALSVLCVVTM